MRRYFALSLEESSFIGPLETVVRGSDQDDYTGLDSRAVYTANSTAVGVADQIKVDFLPDPMSSTAAARACATITPLAKSVEVRTTGVLNYSDEGPHNLTNLSPPVKVTTGSPYKVEDLSLGGSSKLTVEQIDQTTWKVTQDLSAPSRTDIFTNTWNRVDLLLGNSSASRRIKIHVEASVSGTCTGVDASLADGLGGVDSRLSKGPNGCSASWDFTQMAPPGGERTGNVQYQRGGAGGR